MKYLLLLFLLAGCHSPIDDQIAKNAKEIEELKKQIKINDEKLKQLEHLIKND